MRLKNNIHLGYCTNIHRGETWEETFRALEAHTLAVKRRVCANAPYGIGLRLSQRAAIELSEPSKLDAFRRWLDSSECYVFTINGFPYGQFHDTRVKENVYRPDFTTTERVEYTNLLFDLLVKLLPSGHSGSVSTLPGSFKEFITKPEQSEAIFRNTMACCEYVAKLADSTGRDLHLGFEPEPLGWFETSQETVTFFNQLREMFPNDDRIRRCLGVNYDTCHLAVQYEDPCEALQRFREADIRISKIHLSSALKLKPTEEARSKLASFDEPVYLHQVIVRDGGKPLTRFRDLADAFAAAKANPEAIGEEWRVHFHIPLHHQPEGAFGNTEDHLLGVLDALEDEPALCRHLEMETYTWGVLPEEMHSDKVEDQLVREYEWTLLQLKQRGLL